MIQMNAALMTPDNRNISGVDSGHGGGRDHNAQGDRNQGRGRGGQGRGGNVYLGAYSPDQWRAPSAKDWKRVVEGQSAEQAQ